jgi:XTP/dITP diphosphohydrolase
MLELVLGTHNAKKRAELATLLAPFNIPVKTLADFPSPIEVIEDGTTFSANAQKKAVQQAQHLQTWVLGEDSGLCVDALGGAPGIYSARYAALDADDEMNNRHLLQQLAQVPTPQRTAHYVCHMSLSDPKGQIVIDCESTCLGRIRKQASGIHGFGYDPLFELVEYHRTFGELGPAAKSVLSHRARAMRLFLPKLRELISIL